MSQKDVFLSGEGDAWFDRNPKEMDCDSDPVIKAIQEFGIVPRKVLEIGCASGLRLACLRSKFACECHGVDPSTKAVQREGTPTGVQLRQGTADSLPYDDDTFDLAIFGFCLFLCDPADHFRIACETDRVVRSPGFLVILDFNTPIPYRTPYRHHPEIYTRKMDWSRMFVWHPAYRLVSRSYWELAGEKSLLINESIAIDILRKDVAVAFPDNPYS
jgi:ubiquinone/menaquinone biosynthesis C-methylase UbiE